MLGGVRALTTMAATVDSFVQLEDKIRSHLRHVEDGRTRVNEYEEDILCTTKSIVDHIMRLRDYEDHIDKHREDFDCKVPPLRFQLSNLELDPSDSTHLYDFLTELKRNPKYLAELIFRHLPYHVRTDATVKQRSRTRMLIRAILDSLYSNRWDEEFDHDNLHCMLFIEHLMRLSLRASIETFREQYNEDRNFRINLNSAYGYHSVRMTFVSFVRHRSRTYLSKMLRDLVNDMLGDDDVHVELSTLKYFQSVFEEVLSTAKGRATWTTNTFLNDELLMEIPEVKEVVDNHTKCLKQVSLTMLDTLQGDVSKVPIAVRWLGRRLRDMVYEELERAKINANEVVNLNEELDTFLRRYVFFWLVTESFEEPECIGVTSDVPLTMEIKDKIRYIGDVLRVACIPETLSATHTARFVKLIDFIGEVRGRFKRYMDALIDVPSNLVEAARERTPNRLDTSTGYTSFLPCVVALEEVELLCTLFYLDHSDPKRTTRRPEATKIMAMYERVKNIPKAWPEDISRLSQLFLLGNVPLNADGYAGAILPSYEKPERKLLVSMMEFMKDQHVSLRDSLLSSNQTSLQEALKHVLSDGSLAPAELKYAESVQTSLFGTEATAEVDGLVAQMGLAEDLFRECEISVLKFERAMVQVRAAIERISSRLQADVETSERVLFHVHLAELQVHVDRIALNSANVLQHLNDHSKGRKSLMNEMDKEVKAALAKVAAEVRQLCITNTTLSQKPAEAEQYYQNYYLRTMFPFLSPIIMDNSEPSSAERELSVPSSVFDVGFDPSLRSLLSDEAITAVTQKAKPLLERFCRAKTPAQKIRRCSRVVEMVRQEMGRILEEYEDALKEYSDTDRMDKILKPLLRFSMLSLRSSDFAEDVLYMVHFLHVDESERSIVLNAHPRRQNASKQQTLLDDSELFAACFRDTEGYFPLFEDEQSPLFRRRSSRSSKEWNLDRGRWSQDLDGEHMERRFATKSQREYLLSLVSAGQSDPLALDRAVSFYNVLFGDGAAEWYLQSAVLKSNPQWKPFSTKITELSRPDHYRYVRFRFLTANETVLLATGLQKLIEASSEGLLHSLRGILNIYDTLASLKLSEIVWPLLVPDYFLSVASIGALKSSGDRADIVSARGSRTASMNSWKSGSSEGSALAERNSRRTGIDRSGLPRQGSGRLGSFGASSTVGGRPSSTTLSTLVEGQSAMEVVFSWGCTQLLGGHGRNKEPAYVDALSRKGVTQIICGPSHTVFLSTHGVLVCGLNDCGQLGIADRGILTEPTVLSGLDELRFTAVRADTSRDITILASSDGRVCGFGDGFYSGSNCDYAWDVADDDERGHVPRVLTGIPGEVNRVACADGCSMVLVQRDLYLWGRLPSGRFVPEPERQLFPVLQGNDIRMQSNVVVDIAAGYGHMFAVIETVSVNRRVRSHTVFAWSRTVEGSACAHLSGSDYSRIEIPPEWAVESLSPGLFHCAILCKHRESGMHSLFMTGRLPIVQSSSLFSPTVAAKDRWHVFEQLECVDRFDVDGSIFYDGPTTEVVFPKAEHNVLLKPSVTCGPCSVYVRSVTGKAYAYSHTRSGARMLSLSRSTHGSMRSAVMPWISAGLCCSVAIEDAWASLAIHVMRDEVPAAENEMFYDFLVRAYSKRADYAMRLLRFAQAVVQTESALNSDSVVVVCGDPVVQFLATEADERDLHSDVELENTRKDLFAVRYRAAKDDQRDFYQLQTSNVPPLKSFATQRIDLCLHLARQSVEDFLDVLVIEYDPVRKSTTSFKEHATPSHGHGVRRILVILRYHSVSAHEELDTNKLEIVDYATEQGATWVSSAMFRANYLNDSVLVKVWSPCRPIGSLEEERKLFREYVERLKGPLASASVPVIGRCSTTDRLMLVMESGWGESLRSLLAEARLGRVQLPIFAIAYGLASAMKTIHDSNFVHGDLCAGNVFVRRGTQEVRLMDIGIAENMTNVGIVNKRWVAAEVLAGEPRSLKSDVYSYGLILWSLYQMREPYESLPLPLLLERKLSRKRPIPYNIPHPMLLLLSHCWHHDAQSRPSFDKVVEYLQSMSPNVRLELNNGCELPDYLRDL